MRMMASTRFQAQSRPRGALVSRDRAGYTGDMSGRAGLFVVAAVLAVVAPAGCGDESSSQPGQEASVTPTDPSGTPSSPSTPGTPSSPGGAEGPAAAVTDLAKRLSIDPADITVVSAEEVTWSDSSLGCPKPGMMYAQVLVEGSRIVLEANGTRYEYHAAGGKPPFYCDTPKPPVR
jgi:hypothetical protein